MAEIQAEEAERAQLAEVVRLMGGAEPTVRVVAGDEVIDLPPSLVRLLSAGADRLGDGESVAVVSEDAEVSPAQAAQLEQDLVLSRLIVEAAQDHR